MLDIKFIRENPEAVKKSIKDRHLKTDIEKLLKLDTERRKILMELEDLKAKRNRASKGGKPNPEVIKEMKAVSQKVADLGKKVEEIDKKLGILTLDIPNIPHNTIPIGTAKANKVVRKWGKSRKFDFKPKSHIELGEKLDILDFPRSSKITGSGFCLFRSTSS